MPVDGNSFRLFVPIPVLKVRQELFSTDEVDVNFHYYEEQYNELTKQCDRSADGLQEYLNHFLESDFDTVVSSFNKSHEDRHVVVCETYNNWHFVDFSAREIKGNEVFVLPKRDVLYSIYYGDGDIYIRGVGKHGYSTDCKVRDFRPDSEISGSEYDVAFELLNCHKDLYYSEMLSIDSITQSVAPYFIDALPDDALEDFIKRFPNYKEE